MNKKQKILSKPFDLINDDYYAIDLAIQFARRLISSPKADPRHIISIAKALFALARLPKQTPGIFVEFDISCRAGDDRFQEMRYWSVSISEEIFSCSTGGSVHDFPVGGDTLPQSTYEIGIGGYRNTDLDLVFWEDEINDIWNMDIKISVHDDSDDEVLAEIMESEQETVMDG